MQDTKNLRVAHVARDVALLVSRTTAAFPASESYGLTSQMWRAAVSIASNIAEGCGRRSNRELLQVLYVAMGSASELQCQCELAAEHSFDDASAVRSTSREVERLESMLSRLITALRQQPARRTSTEPQ
jgi:four helix bundle protein